jgi:hypothetical protein
MSLSHLLISYIDTSKAKSRHLKKIDLYRDFAEGVYLSEAQKPIHPPPPLKHCTVLCTCI